MNCDTNIAAHLSIRPKVNGQLYLAGFIDFITRICWITVDIPDISVVEKIFGLN